jgi:hypothetical protein
MGSVADEAHFVRLAGGWMGRVRLWVVFFLALLLAACAGPRSDETRVPSRAGQTTVAALPPSMPVECVPYARLVSGIEIYGDAWTWWTGSRGRYAQGQAPQLLAVLVLSRTDRLRRGHVAVVTDIVSAREIRVSHANWGWDRRTRHRVLENMPVIDVSSDNSWRAVRFWNDESGTFGRVYPAYGFIYRDSQVASGS